MTEYQNEPAVPRWHYLVPVLILLAMGVAGWIEREGIL